MKKVLLSLAAVTAIAAAVPAAAQSYGRYTPDYRSYRVDDRMSAVSLNERQAAMYRKIDQAARGRQINPYAANQLIAEMRRIDAVERRYRDGRYTLQERRDISARLDRVQYELQQARSVGMRYGYGYGNRW